MVSEIYGPIQELCWFVVCVRKCVPSSIRTIYSLFIYINVSKVWRQSFCSITVQSYIVVILSSSFILLLMALLIVRHGYDYIESTLPVFLVSYCMKCVHD